MKLSLRRICGAASTVAVLMGTGILAVAAPASAQSAQPWPHAAATAQTATVFDLNGTYTDGGSARPRITDVSDVLTVDMSSQNRPTATGIVLGTRTIKVTFPDIPATFQGTLTAPGRIEWNNGSVWTKLPYVPEVIGDTKAVAVAAVQAAGFTPVVHMVTCEDRGLVDQQNPAARTQRDAGSLVHIFVCK